jgi:hypothetical protein
MQRTTIVPVVLTLFLSAACGGSEQGGPSPQPSQSSDDHGQEHAEGDNGHDHASEEADHEHDEHSLGTAAIGDLQIEFAQGHGGVVAGKEGHLVVKLPYSDSGGSVVRAWIGTKDRTRSLVGKGEYAPSHDEYDVHASAPDPLPADAMWWVEIEKPDGTKSLGSVKPLFE